MEKTKIKQEEGICPKCGSKNLNYETSTDYGCTGAIYYEYCCYDCEFEGQEWYLLEFKDHLDSQGYPIE